MRSITLRLALAFIAISILSTVLVVVFTRWRSREEFRTFLIEQNRPGIVVAFSNYYQEHGSWQGVSDARVAPLQPPASPGPSQRSAFTVVDAGSGRVVLAGAGYQVGAPVPSENMAGSIPIESGGKTVGFLLINRPVYRIAGPGSAYLDRINLQVVLGGAVAIVLALVLAIVLSRTLTKPIRELTLATGAVASGVPAQPVPVRSRDELGQLAVAFNRMRADLSRSLELRRQMTADIAHELRTPLSIIIGHAEAVHDGVLAPSAETFEIIREEASRLEHLVDDLRTLSMADAGELKLTLEATHVAELLHAVETTFRHRAMQKQVSIEVAAAPDLPRIQLDRQRMKEVLSNLMDNALRYTPPGGRIRMSATAGAQGVVLRIQDSGPGMAPEDLSKAFERFYRADASRSREEGGSGLGLAIARSIVERHGGQIAAESAPGEGMTVIITLPPAAA